mgnify:CR=1 FL=1
MNKILVERFMANKDAIRTCFNAHPASYTDVVKAVVSNITTGDYGECALDPERIHEIDDGNYQGTLLFVIAEKGYQPSDYWYVMVGYGSCSGCDTLQSIRGYDDSPATESQKDEYMTLALHIVQGLKKMNSQDEA